MKNVVIGFSGLLLLLLFPQSVGASGLVTIDKAGQVVWNVLSSEDPKDLQITEPGDVSVKQIAQLGNQTNASITLKKKDGQVSLEVLSDSGKKEIDVSDWQQNLVEIEERPEVQKLSIGLSGGKFSLKQGSIVALTDLPIDVDAKLARLSVQTSTGTRFVSILPRQAAYSLLQAKYISELNSSMELKESSDTNIVYHISGERVINLFNVYNYRVPVDGEVSASTGEIVSVNEPIWLKVIGFIFS
jgi:hypothetical protein